MIRLNDLNFSYNMDTTAEITALSGIDAVIHNGEFIAMLGHNGSGKSTLAKHLNALLLPTSGEVIVDNMDTKDPDLVWNIRKKCGMVFQNPDNQMVATVIEEEVAFGPENLGMAPEDIRERVYAALDSVGIGRLMAKKSSSYLSGGQKQRLAIAGIIAMHNEYLILDEATSMLDPRGRREVLDTVKRLNREEGITVIYITHSMEEAIHADRIIVIDDGRIAMEGIPSEIFSQVDRLRELGLDVPPMVELAHCLRNRNLDVPDDIFTLDDMADLLAFLVAGADDEYPAVS